MQPILAQCKLDVYLFFKGTKCRLSEYKGNSFTLPSVRQLDVVIAGYVTAKKKETDVFEYKKRRNDRLL